MTYLLTVVKVAEPGRPGNSAVAAVHSEVHPAATAAPGQTLRLALTVQAAPGARHAYGYLDTRPFGFGEAAEVLAVQGVEYLPERRTYRVRAQGGAAETGYLTLRIRPETAEPVLRPAIAAAVPGEEPRKPVRTEPLADLGVRIRRFHVPGRALNVAPHAAHLPALLDPRQGLPPGTVLTGHGQARHGTVSVTPEGVLAYQAAPGAQGYDGFAYTVRSPHGETAEGQVVVYVGDLSATPGLLTPPGANGAGTTAHLPWRQPKIIGELPWPPESRTG
ncbi:Ig-like domain-containing protein [Streptomyces sp. NPDC101132]|uniref:Ig-like domain-containing protein n=1 Tax=Streptomyces sp. NPDC101132 TaxID=3366110 RepID=UPI0037F14DF6